MSDFKPGDKVTVRIGGVEISATFEQFDPIDPAVVEFTVEDGNWYSAPADRVAPVTPPCPWTELGTIVMTQPMGHLFQLELDGWWSYTAQMTVDYAGSIAPFNPVQLVPVVSS